MVRDGDGLLLEFAKVRFSISASTAGEVALALKVTVRVVPPLPPVVLPMTTPP
jgi:hypothetical protein